ncbi:transposase [Ferrimonas pelagia]|uniref:Transposase n=1 Tax=Ferrimonas pelagia TaxID=1177826 RepID=A0ABP9F4A0_9GAMM
MSNNRYMPKFKDEVVKPIVGQRHSVQKVSERIGVSTHSIYQWVKAVKPAKQETTQVLNPQLTNPKQMGATCLTSNNY